MHVQDKRGRKRQKGLCESLFLGELKSVGVHLLMTSAVDGGLSSQKADNGDKLREWGIGNGVGV